MTTPAARRLRALLATADGPVSIDALVESRLWTPAELWALVDEARRDGVVAADAGAGPGQLRWADDARRGAAVAGATAEDLDALAAHPAFAACLLAGARSALRAHDFRRAASLHRALVAVPNPADLPGGEATWLEVTVDAIRLVRSGALAPPAVLDAAIAAAEERGDLRARAVLLAARGLHALATDPAQAQALYERAAEAADALGDPAIRGEVRVYIAVSLVFAGRLRDGIAAFEELLGDVPADVLDAAASWLDPQAGAPAPELAVLAWAYVSVGDFPRALDLLGRMAAAGVELGNAALEAQGRLFLALTRVLAGDPEAAAADAEAAHAYWAAGAGAEPMYAWFAAISLAAVRAHGGALREAHALLQAALPCWHASGRPWVGGSTTLELLGRLEAAGLRLDGLTADGEIARHVDGPHTALAGIALRVRARRLLEAGVPGAAERAAADLERAVELLSKAETPPELRGALADAVALAEAQGRADDAARLRAALDAAPAVAVAPPGARGSADVLRLAGAFVDLGRLAALPRGEGVWGDVAARLCRELGAERCAIVEDAEGGPRLLGARGAPRWQQAVRERLRAAPPRQPAFEPALAEAGARAGGQLVLVPFADEELRRRGWVALENREIPPRVGPEDAPVLRLLGRQAAILVANVAASRELLAARRRLEQENRYHREATPSAPLGGRFVGRSAAMREVLELVARVAPTTTPVLVTGETGVGKELVSREVHQLSLRRDGPFIAVHVAALPPGLVASALFGHERGAFTGATEQARGRFELADGGTIFLDEIGELSLEHQVKLLRVLQEGTFERVGGTRLIRSDFRLVAATNRDLPAEVRAGRFREDLYFRLAAFPIRVPALRERTEEIATLALYFMERAARKLGVVFEGISEADMVRLVDYPWPGNVRELEHLIERAVLLSQPPRLQIPPLETDARPPRPARPAPSEVEREGWVTLEELERRYIRDVLRHVGGKVNGRGGAAEVLGLKASTLQFWIDKLGLREDLSRARRAAPR